MLCFFATCEKAAVSALSRLLNKTPLQTHKAWSRAFATRKGARSQQKFRMRGDVGRTRDGRDE